MTKIEKSKAYQYAAWCILPDNDKVGVYVKRQSEAWLKIADGRDDTAYVDIKQYRKICALLKLMIHPDLNCTMYSGLEPYAWLLITAVLCTKYKDNGQRYYTTALLEICRKNFKTFTSAVIFILLMITEPRFSRFFSVAPDLKLSKELQSAIRKIIKSSPALNEYKAFKLLRSEIRCNITDSEYTPLAYSEDRMDGKLANAFLADEAGAMDCYPIEAMRSSQITLKDKLGIVISTQYPNENNALTDEIDIAKKSLDGLIENQRVFALLYEPDIELINVWQTDDRVIYQGNPVAVNYEYIFKDLKSKRELAILYENRKENFLCKHCNIQYRGLGVEGYVDIEAVKKCRIVSDPEFWRGKRVFLGLDLSETDDNTSVAMVTEADGMIYAKVWAFIPKNRIELKNKKEHVDYNVFIKNGYCFATGDDIIGYDEVEAFIMKIPELFGVEIVQLGFDRHNAISTVQKLEANTENPIECVEIKQHSSVLHPATKLLYERILQNRFRYDKRNRLLEINFQNARCTEDTNKNKYVNKKKSAGKVDMVVSLINAIYLLFQDELFGGDAFDAFAI